MACCDTVYLLGMLQKGMPSRGVPLGMTMCCHLVLSGAAEVWEGAAAHAFHCSAGT